MNNERLEELQNISYDLAEKKMARAVKACKKYNELKNDEDRLNYIIKNPTHFYLMLDNDTTYVSPCYEGQRITDEWSCYRTFGELERIDEALDIRFCEKCNLNYEEV